MLWLMSLLGAAGSQARQAQTSRKIEVAMIAHFYPKHGYDDENLRVYLCGLHGENRRVIPGDASLWPVEWEDATHVVWLTASDPDSANADLERIYDLRSGKTTTIHADRNGHLPDDLLSHEAKFSQENDTVVTSLDRRYPGQFGFGSDGRSFVLRRNGSVIKYAMPYHAWNGLLFDKPTNRVWFFDRGHVSGGGTWNALYRLDWLTGKAAKLFDGIDDYGFSPHRAIYAAAENFHLPAWARTRWPHLARAWIGNWKTGRKWPIVGSKVYVTSIALRPPGARALKHSGPSAVY